MQVQASGIAPSRPEFPTFYIDDSASQVSGKKHVILVALSFVDEDDALAAWLQQKMHCGVHPAYEIKWNDSSMPIEQRRKFVPLLNRGTGIVVLDESTKQDAALRLCTKVWQYCNETGKSGFRLRFDKGIITNWLQFQAHARGLYPPCVGVSEHDSASEQLLQCADLLAGAMKLKIDFGLGTKDPNIMILADGEDVGTQERMELGFYFFAALRYCLWGDVRDFGDGQNTFDPRKMVLGRGLTVYSSVPADIIDRAVAYLDGEYMGCIH